MIKILKCFTKIKILIFLLCLGLYTLLSSIWSIDRFNSMLSSSSSSSLSSFSNINSVTFKQGMYTTSKCSIPQMNLWPKEKYYQFKNDIKLPKCKETTLFNANNSLNKIISIHEYLTIHMGKLTIQKSIINNSDSIICSLFPIKRLNDYQSIYLSSIEEIHDGYQSKWSMFMILCQPKQNILLIESEFNENHIRSNQIERLFICGSYRSIEQIEKLKQSIFRRKHNDLMFNVLLLGIDSMSRLSAYRYLIKTIQFLQTINNSAVIMNLYNVIGDGTTVNLLGLLTGQLEIELPESRKSHIHMMSKDNLMLNNNDNYTVLDNYPWIWKEFSEYNDYVTHYIEDTPKWGTFQHRLCGFGSFNSPTTSYGRPCLIAASQEERYSEKILGCTMSRYTHQVLLESLTEFFTIYSDKPRFSLTFLSELIHENPAYGKLIDDDLVKLLQRIYYEDQMFNKKIPGKFSHSNYPFANTLVILFSDHGPRMGDARLSVQVSWYKFV
ncbi:hypothetical protein KSF78_0003809 [Schistosoma japonicum]|nr:hypothetical protein KSF78_0003809 [Schistosoma japonicum]